MEKVLTSEEKQKIYQKNYYLENKLKKQKQYENNKEEILNKNKKYREENKEKIKEQRKKYRENNKEKIKESYNIWKNNNLEKLKTYSKNYRVKNKNRINEYVKNYRKNNKKYKENKKSYENNRFKYDFLFKLKLTYGSLIRKTINRSGYTKKSRTHDILGCSFEEFKLYLESKFEPWMTWDNYGNPKDGIYEPNKTWDIDHIIPTSSANTEEELLKLNHYSNLQPLCSYYNRFIKRDN